MAVKPLTESARRDLMASMVTAYRAAKSAERAYKSLADEARAAGITTIIAPDGHGTLVEADDEIIDLDMLKTSVSPAAFNAVTIRKINLTVWRERVANGKISAEIVARVRTFQARTPYYRITLH